MNLNQKINTITKVFEIDKIISKTQNSYQIQKYYQISHLAYLLFHNPKGYMHMGISQNNKLRDQDILTHLKIIKDLIDETSAKNVLELGSGNGANSVYLAKKNPAISFMGIDLSKKIRTNLKNYSQYQGDYHSLKNYKDNTFDLVFAIETICHSNNKSIIFSEVNKKLKTNGLFVIFDAYLKKPISKLTKDELLAKKLTEKSMAVDNFEELNDFEKEISNSKFIISKSHNYSKNILPSLYRLEKLSKAYFKIPQLAKIINKIIPEEISQNAIAAYLMPTLIETEIACYYLHVLRRKS